MTGFLLGFLIAACIAMTGVGAGTITAPLLILFLHLPATLAVSIALVWSAVIKLIIVPIQIARRLVVWKALLFMLITGIPGVVAGSLLFRHVATLNIGKIWLYIALGASIVFSSSWYIYRHFCPRKKTESREHLNCLALCSLPIGLEMGFSSSGAGALGSISLLGLTRLTPQQVVGTDLVFGFVLSAIGGGLHLTHLGQEYVLLKQLTCGGLLGALVGAGIMKSIPVRPMRLALSIWLLLIGLQLCWQATSLAAK